MYAKDLSRKVKIAKRSRAMDGLFIAAQVPYGYKKDPLNKNHLIVDENIRPIIKKIFTLALNGNGTYKIAKQLSNESVMTPSKYKALNGDTRFNRFTNTNWNVEAVNKILSDMVYCGHLENHKYEVANYKTKKRVRVNDNEHIIVYNTHEAIISDEDYKAVQNLIQSRVSPRVHETENLFKGIVFCSHCGSRMLLSHQKRSNEFVSIAYKCPKHNKDSKACPESNTILYRQLKELVLNDIRKLLKTVNREDFLQRYLEVTNNKNSKDKNLKEINKLKTKKESLYQLIKKVYQDNQLGILDSEMVTV